MMANEEASLFDEFCDYMIFVVTENKSINQNSINSITVLVFKCRVLRPLWLEPRHTVIFDLDLGPVTQTHD